MPTSNKKMVITREKIVAELNFNSKLQDKTNINEYLVKAASDFPDLVEPLLKAGADVDYQNWAGWTALLMACDENPYLVKMLLQTYHANPNLTTINGQNSPLMICCKQRPELVADLLLAGVNVNYISETGRTALKVAAMHNPELLEVLIKAGADVNLTKKGYQTALSEAIHHNHLDGALCLLKHGAKVDLIVNAEKGHNVLFIAAEFFPGSIPHLQKYGIDINSKNKKGNSILMECAVDHPQRIVELLDYGVDPDLKNAQGETALHSMSDISFYYTKEIKELISKMKDPNPFSKVNKSPLFFAINRSGRTGGNRANELIKLLIEAGANPHQSNKNKITALQYAIENRKFEAVEIIYELSNNNEALEKALTGINNINPELKSKCQSILLNRQNPNKKKNSVIKL